MTMLRNRATVHHLLRTAILVGLTALLARLLFSGDMLLYIAPHLMLYARIATAGVTILALCQGYLTVASLRHPAIGCACGRDHDHDHAPPASLGKNVVLYGLFLLPLLFGAVVPNAALAGSLARNKGMNLAGAAVPNGASLETVELEGDADQAIKAMFRTNVYNKDYAKLGMLLYRQDAIEMKDEWFIEKLQAMNLFVDNFQGKRVTLTGFVYRESGLADDQFIVGRMAMTHCIADISPYGIVVEAPDAAGYPNDAWLTVDGTIDRTTFQGREVIRIVADGVISAKAPTIPYVYPDWNFASKL
ncbi:TIGR03943 family protein [Cohnella sp. REN36]|uniref:TIGR03943 family putative permease subunit n=1 Tax=Cohnella sp. REN36 TaxID=2887347 RepID=UPI001D1442AB|nr:TIGR03943 family protein [Cohnella sp. REN36]MCC3375438.1 TIGR03943 family protein [Cohnella sp. REN36]